MAQQQYGLGRAWVDDPNDTKFPLRTITRADAPERKTPWRIGSILDQGQTEECVLYTFREWLNAEPISDPDTLNPAPDDLYAKVQAIDGIPMPHEGTNDRAMMKYAQTLSLVDAYHWAESLDAAEQYILHNGPLMCGMPWDRPMFRTDAQGFVYPNGDEAGGHEFLSYWVERVGGKRQWRFQQSWGLGYGVPDFDVQERAQAGGTFRMADDAFANLFGRGGDLCAAQLVLKPVISPPASPPKHKRRWHFFPF